MSHLPPILRFHSHPLHPPFFSFSVPLNIKINLNNLLTILEEEAVSENLKNMLLVMSNGGYLAPPDEHPEREELWNETWKRINRFQPHLFAELFPEEAGKPARPRTSKDERGSREVDAAVQKSKEVQESEEQTNADEDVPETKE